MKKRIVIVVLIVAAVFVLGIAVGAAVMSFLGTGISTGYCLKSDNGTLFLIKGNTPVRLSGFESSERLSELETGDSIFVIHDGIAESYPASTGVRFIVRTSKGSADNIPSDVIDSLCTLGWLSEEKIADKECGFSADYVKTGTPYEEIALPEVTVIDSCEKLSEYERLNRERLSLGTEFSEMIKKYDEDFFIGNSLVLIYLSEGSSSISHTVTEVKRSSDKMKIFIETDSPEAGTCDMAYHHFFVSVSREDAAHTTPCLYVDGRDVSTKGERVELSHEYANLSLSLPLGWKYEKHDVYGENRRFGISFFHESSPESTIVLEFSDAFGVCGTDLSVTDVTIAGYKAVKGVYGNNPAWDYIHFSDAPGEYVIYNNTDTSWWNEQREELNEILETIVIADGIMFRDDALAVALKNAEGEYKRTYGEYNCEKGVWEFSFITRSGENEVTELYTVNG